jgi:F-type H+-transporting ATPase subunit gamma
LNDQVQLVLVGRKGEQWFIKRETPVAASFILGNVPQPSVGSDLANLLVGQFLSGEVDAAEIIFTRFNNLISYDPTIRTLLPLSLSGIESENDEVFKVTTKDGKMTMAKQPAAGVSEVVPEYIFEDEPVGILETMLTLYFSATLMRCMQESVASELASRMTGKYRYPNITCHKLLKQIMSILNIFKSGKKIFILI